MSETLQETLEKSILPAEWALLAVHQEREALLIVEPPLGLLDAAVALAEDDSTSVQQWLEAGVLHRPTAAQVEAWAVEEELRFDFVIVQPFVLARIR